MKITQLTAENVKRLKAVTITPDGSIVQVTGKNGQGKSSVLDSIAYALGGRDAICAVPVRAGEKKAKIICQLDDLTVTRTFTAEGGGVLTVTNAEGARYPSPQAVLDKLVGKLTLDPLEFVRLPAKQQSEVLRRLVGLDFAEMDRTRVDAYTSRTMVNRSAAEAQSKVDAMPKHDAPEKEIVVTDLIAERDRRSAENAASAKRASRAALLNQAIVNQQAMASEAVSRQNKIDIDFDALSDQLDAELKAETDRLKEIYVAKRTKAQKAKIAAIDAEKANHQRAERNKADAQKELATIENTPVAFELDTITKAISEAEVVNRKVRENERREQAAEYAEGLRKNAELLTKKIDAIDAAKAEALASAAFPVPGLSFNESGVLLKGLPFEQASSAEQLRTSVAIGLAMNPKLRVLLIRDGSLLDSGGFTALAEMAEQMDAQVWIERVDDSGSVGVVIEDGCVAEPTAP